MIHNMICNGIVQNMEQEYHMENETGCLGALTLYTYSVHVHKLYVFAVDYTFRIPSVRVHTLDILSIHTHPANFV